MNPVEKIWDINPSIGGPIQKDRLWFYGSYRNWGAYTRIAGLYWDTDVRDNVFVPDLSRPAIAPNDHWSADLKLTWQLSAKNKIGVFVNPQYSSFGAGYTVTAASAREGVIHARFRPQYVIQANWSAPITNRLLLQAAGGLTASDSAQYPQDSSPSDLPSITERRTGFTYRVVRQYGHRRSNNYRFRGSASYVTGSHNFKGGFELGHAWNNETREVNNGLNLELLDGIPNRVVVWAIPISWLETMKYNLGLYAQDQWSIRRLTLNVGVRADFINDYIRETELAAGPFVGARHFPAVLNAPSWQDVAPRLGINYDLSGNGKTSVKAVIGRYVVGGATNFARPVNPVDASVTSVIRTWTDTNNNFMPDCHFRDPGINSECGRIDNLNFGQANPNATQYDPEYRKGFGKRAYNWNTSVSIQHELFPRVSVGGGFFHRWYGNFTVTDNLLFQRSDFSEYCITAPVWRWQPPFRWDPPPRRHGRPRRRPSRRTSRPFCSAPVRTAIGPGRFAPMSLLTYEEARPWASAIKRRVAAREMPPWFIEKNVGIQKFKDDPSLSDDEIATIVRWADAEAPRGNQSDMPPPRVFDSAGWSIGTPDLVISTPEVTLKAMAPDWWTNHSSIDTGLTEDRWVQAVEVKPTPEAQTVVHHAGVSATAPSDGDNSGEVRDAEASGGLLSLYELGRNAEVYPENSGRLIKAGTKLNFSMHYHSIGREVKARTEIALKFYPKGTEPKYKRDWVYIGNVWELDIPAGQDNIRFDSYYDVAPLLPMGTIVHVTGWYDNTARNPRNQDPRNWAGFGNRTVDDMAISFMNVVWLTDEQYQEQVAARKAKSAPTTTAGQNQQE